MLRIMCCRGDIANLTILSEVLGHDHNIIGLDETVIFTPQVHSVSEIASNMTIIHEDEIIAAYPKLSRLKGICRNWYFQQALKWCALDHLDYEQVLIQDSDAYVNVSYEPIRDNNLNFISKPGVTWHRNGSYGKFEVYAKVMHRYPIVNDDCITEFCPFTKSAWASLKRRIEYVNGMHWLDAVIASIDPSWNDFQGFYEYYFMINHVAHEKIPYQIIPMTWAPLNFPAADIDRSQYQRITYEPTIPV